MVLWDTDGRAHDADDECFHGYLVLSFRISGRSGCDDPDPAARQPDPDDRGVAPPHQRPVVAEVQVVPQPARDRAAAACVTAAGHDLPPGPPVTGAGGLG